MKRDVVWTLGALLMMGAGCTSPDKEAVSDIHQADFVNGNFETGDLNGWTVTTGLRNSGLSVVPPTQLSQLALTAGGNNFTKVQMGATPESVVPSGLTASDSLRIPRFGQYSVVVNELGMNKNSNRLTQSLTTTPADVDVVDGNIHIRFALAPVLQNPNPPHANNLQPYFYIEINNMTQGKRLWSSFNFSNQSGVPWKNTAGNTAQYTDWQLFDLAPGPVDLAVGDTVVVDVVATGCQPGGHWGMINVDGFGAFVPGLTVAATAARSANANTDLTYTFYARNGANTPASNVIVNETLPAGTTFVSVSGATCTTPMVGSAGTLMCNLGTLNASAGTTFQVTVHIDPAAMGTINNSTYSIQGMGISPIIGPLVQTMVTSGVTYTDLAASVTDGNAAVGWGTPLTYTAVVRNNGPSAVTGAMITNNVPAQLTGVSWNCTGSGGATCPAASGTGSIGGTVDLPVGGVLTYTVNASIVAGTGTGSTSYNVSIAAPTGVTDNTPINNAAVDTNGIGTVDMVTVTKGGAGTGNVVSSPSGISCGPSCPMQAGGFLDGSSVTLNATAAPGSIFAGWGGDCASAGTAPQCTLTLSAAANVTANFAPLFDITVNVPGGNGTITCQTPVATGMNSVCTIAPSSGFGLSALTLDGTDVLQQVSGGMYTITNVTAPHTVQGTFAPAYDITVNVPGGNGTVTCQTPVISGGNSVCMIMPAAGYGLGGLTLDGTDVLQQASGNTYTITNVTAEHTLQASFVMAFTITTNVLAGSGTISCQNPVLAGSNSLCTITPASGYGLSSLTLDGTNVMPQVMNNTYTVTNVMANHAVQGTFSLITYNISVMTPGGNGSITCSSPVLTGQTSVCQINPAVGYMLGTLTLDGANYVPQVNGNSFTIPNVTANHALQGTFVPMMYTITSVVPGGNGTITCPPPVMRGQNVSCTITPNTGYILGSLTLDGVDARNQVVGNMLPISNVTASHTVQGTFIVSTSTITVNVPGGNGTVVCSTPVLYGQTSVCQITPAPGYRLSTLTQNGVDVKGQVSGNSFSIGSVTSPHTIDATFELIPLYDVAVSVPGGNGTISCPTSIPEGTSVVCTITPAAGYELDTLILDGSNAIPLVQGNGIAVSNVVSPRALAGTFKKSNGNTCAAAGECHSGFCADGFCCNRACNEQCEACDVSGQAGTCGPIASANGREVPRANHPSCGNFMCGGAGCLTECSSNSDCISGSVCANQVCVKGTQALTGGGYAGCTTTGNSGAASGGGLAFLALLALGMRRRRVSQRAAA